jgi:membrane protein implicated in regulation of membrane protease activity
MPPWSFWFNLALAAVIAAVQVMVPQGPVGGAILFSIAACLVTLPLVLDKTRHRTLQTATAIAIIAVVAALAVVGVNYFRQQAAQVEREAKTREEQEKQNAKTREESLMKEAQIRFDEAMKEAEARFSESMKGANARFDEATSRALRLENEVAQLKRRTDEELDRWKPRHLTEAQMAALVLELIRALGFRVSLARGMDRESSAYAMEFKGVFERGGWIITDITTMGGLGVGGGLRILASHQDLLAVRPLIAKLTELGVEVNFITVPNHAKGIVSVTIGERR